MEVWSEWVREGDIEGRRLGVRVRLGEGENTEITHKRGL